MRNNKQVKDFENNPINLEWELYNLSLIAKRSTKDTPIPLVKEFHYVKKHCTNLLSIAGSKVVMPAVEVANHDISLKSGKLIEFKEIIKKRGQVNACHANSARYWKRNKSTCKLVTGYALLSNLWISHSWVMTKKNQILDSTIKADKYYGVILNNTQAEQFCKKILLQN